MAILQKSVNDELSKLREENNRLKKSIEDLWSINQLARMISSTMPVEEILEHVASVSVKALGAEQGTISLVDEQEIHDPFKTIIRKVDNSSIKGKLRLDEELSGWMMKNRKPLMINDFSEDTTFSGFHSSVKKIESVLSVPLLCKGKFIGILNLFNKKNMRGFTSDDQRLLSIIGSQSAQVIESARLYEQEKKLQLVEVDLAMAMKIQQRLLPKETPPIPGFDVCGVSYAAKDVGGDYFDFIKLNDHQCGIALGDVSGKGVQAALLMSNIQATLRNQAMVSSSITDCIKNANHFLYLNTESNKFATLFYGILDCEKKTFRFVNAGHNFPCYFDQSGQFHTLEKGGLVLGMLPEYPYEEDTISIQPGEIVVIYSDGVTEAENLLEDQFGEERLMRLISENKDLSSNELMKKIYDEVKKFEGNKDQEDDITLVIIKAI